MSIEGKFEVSEGSVDCGGSCSSLDVFCDIIDSEEVDKQLDEALGPKSLQEKYADFKYNLKERHPKVYKILSYLRF